MTSTNDTPRSSSEIDHQIHKAAESIVSIPDVFGPDGACVRGWTTRWHGATFEQGVYEALQWVTGRSDKAPMGVQ